MLLEESNTQTLPASPLLCFGTEACLINLTDKVKLTTEAHSNVCVFIVRRRIIDYSLVSVCLFICTAAV